MAAMNHISRAGTGYALLPSHDGAPAPTLILLASTAVDTLTTEPYGAIGRLLHARGWNVASLDLPCHGMDRRAGEPPELDGWAARTARGEDFVAAFVERVRDVVEHLIATGVADARRVAAAGTSRGGFLAFHAAAGNPLIRAVAAFAPVTDLRVLREFAGLNENPLVRRVALVNAAEPLADRAAWLCIGHADERVGTDRAVSFARALEQAAARRGLPPRVTLRVFPEPGHVSREAWHALAAEWMGSQVTGGD